jgi:hypothetical protein
MLWQNGLRFVTEPWQTDDAGVEASIRELIRVVGLVSYILSRSRLVE